MRDHPTTRLGPADDRGVDLDWRLRHHGDVEAGDGLADFAVNVAVPAPPGWLADRLHAAVAGLARYPDAREATAALAAAHGVAPENVLLTNGAAEGFHLVARAQRWRAPLVVHPQFTEPDTALAAAGHTPTHHLLAAEADFRLDPDAVPREPDLVVVGNPTNPTSRLHPPRDLLALRRPGRLVLVDEAFLDVVADPRPPDRPHSVVADAAASPGLVVVRSLTKTFGLAGVRAGYLVSTAATIAACRAVQPHWSVNALALAAVLACVEKPGLDHVAAVAAALPADRDSLVAGLERAGLAVVADPAGPFVLARHPRAAQLRAGLRAAGFAVRRGDTFPGLDDEWIRIAVRPPAATAPLLDAIATELADAPTRPGKEDT